MSTNARVSIPSSVRKTIHNIKEITGNPSEEEIYATLKECSMDPNETAQKLLLQVAKCYGSLSLALSLDTFHEVKRKRDKRKENLNNKESAELRWRPGMQGRWSSAGRGNYLPRYFAHDIGGGRNSAPGKENGFIHISDKGVGLPSSPTSQNTKNKQTTPTTSSVIVVTDGSTDIASEITGAAHTAHLSAGGAVNQSEEVSTVGISKLRGSSSIMHPVGAKENPTIDFGTGDTLGQLTPSSNNSSASMATAPSSRDYFSDSDSVLVPPLDSRLPSAMVTIEHGTQSLQHITVIPVESKSTALPSKEWKAKPTNPNLAQGSGTAGSSEVPNKVEANTRSGPVFSALDSMEATSKLQRRKLDKLHISDVQHVIFPSHIHVPEVENFGFCFGSFDTSFGFSTSSDNDRESDKSATTPSEISARIEETVEQSSSNQNALATAEEGDFTNHPQSPTHVPENFSSSEGDVLSTAVPPEYTDSKQETTLLPVSSQCSTIHTASNYNFGFMPPMLSSQLAPFESSESQPRDVSHLPSFVVPQPLDPTCYAQFYRFGADSDGRVSPFYSPGVAAKYNGSVTVLSPQTSQPPQEGGNSVVLSTAGPTPLVTQAAVVMQNSIALTQQPLPLFRLPTGVHIPYYPQNFIPYGHYISPFYVPPPAVHQILSNGAFPQQPQAGSVYPPPPAATAKFSLPQYKPGTNAGNATHIVLPGSHGPYGSSPAGYSPSLAVTNGNSAVNEDLASSQLKESNVYITAQQTEGSAVWITPPGRDISALQAGSFYNIHPGQVTFNPMQASHGTFPGFYQPAQAVTPASVHPLLQVSQTVAGAVDMVGPTAGVFQQLQHAQINWPSSF
ncbi:GBF-interacting protein 1-like isoform X2 [Cornus florida]|uniref:GBF-interacting protein 1-like isoform X2 n=1 Tax=Cornus florida TaxID=4283 RepID=UPI0028A0B2E4|nr:GBF-interacting protein 1-like isoform X2 [Cornus florida]